MAAVADVVSTALFARHDPGPEAQRGAESAWAEILAAHGYDESEIARVETIVAKRGIKTDPQVQTHEDALCLAFIELQFDDLTHQLGHDHMVEVVRKTAAKMSPAGLAASADSFPSAPSCS